MNSRKGRSNVIAVAFARIVGSAVVATLHTNPAFQQQLQKAKDEFAKRQK
ncbi:hypothetical protein [Klebsiella pneumoniae]